MLKQVQHDSNMVILYIDTSSNKEISVSIKVNDKKNVLTEDITVRKSQAVLPLIDKLLRKHQLRPNDIDAIEVNTGPGSFTGLRVGLSVANALGFALNIPVNKKKAGRIVTPMYEAQPQ